MQRERGFENLLRAREIGIAALAVATWLAHSIESGINGFLDPQLWNLRGPQAAPFANERGS